MLLYRKALSKAKIAPQIFLSGHSLGSVLGELYGYVICYGVKHKLPVFKQFRNASYPINIIAFGAPKLGSGQFIRRYNMLINDGSLRLDRIISKSSLGLLDPVVQMPPSMFSVHKQVGYDKNTAFRMEQLLSMFKNEKVLHKLSHPKGTEVIVQENKDLKSCPYITGFFCHTNYLGYSFIHLVRYYMRQYPFKLLGVKGDTLVIKIGDYNR